MYIRNDRTNQKIYQTYIKRYSAMCILRGADNLTELLTKDKFLEEYDTFFKKKGTVTNAITSIIQQQVKK